MHKFTRRFAVIAAALLCGFVSLAGKAEARDLKLSIHVNENHFLTREVFQPFAENVAKLTNGELKIQIYPSGVLGKAAAHLEMVETGVADIAFVVANYTRGRFPFYESASLPFAFESSTHGGAVYEELQEKYLNQSGFSTVKPLVVAVTNSSGLLMAKKPITALDQIKGLNIRGSSAEQSRILSELGANTVSMPIPDVYVALERGALDGLIIPTGSAVGYKLEEVTKFYTPMYFAATPVCVVMNKSVWESLTPAQQEGLQKAADIAQEAIKVAYDQSEKDGDKTFTEAGGTIVNMPDSDLQKLRELAAPLWDEFEAGLARQKDAETAKAFMADLRAAIEKHRSR